ncbi:hypothetical protein TIFTF001_052846, partial [Ficus carica]
GTSSEKRLGPTLGYAYCRLSSGF